MKGSQYLIDSKTARISKAYANMCNMPTTEAMAIFFDSATCQALNDEETGLYLEIFEHVYELFLEERGELAA